MKRPLLLVAICWLLGAFIAFGEWQHSILLAALCLSVLIVMLCHPRHFGMSYRMITLMVGALLLSFTYNLAYERSNVSQIDAAQLKAGSTSIEGTIISPPDVDGDHVSFVIIDKRKERFQVFLRLHGKAEQRQASEWQRGDATLITGVLQQPEAARNFAAFEYRTYLYYQKIHWIIQVENIADLTVSSPHHWHPRQLLHWTDAVRAALGAKVDRIFAPDYSGFMKSLLIGVRDDVQPEHFRQFSLIGLTHIMAISGLHVAVFIAGCMAVLKLCRFTKETSITIMFVIIPCYMLLTGAAPSVVRAGLMALIGLYLLRRQLLKDGLNVIAAVGLFMLIIKPYYLYQISFQLSFIVTFGLITLVPRLNALFSRSTKLNSKLSSKLIINTISVTIAAQLCSFPFTIYYFNHFSPLSFLANLLLVPLLSVLVIPLGMLALVISLGSELVASWLGAVVDVLNTIIFAVVRSLNGFKSFHFSWVSPSLLWIALYFASLAFVLWSMRRWREQGGPRSALYFSGSLIALFVLLLYGYFPDYFDRHAYVSFVDVGQGDAIIVRTPERKIILIDGGGTMRFAREGDEWRQRRDPYEVGKNVLVPLLKKRGIDQLDAVILTHADVDHFGGLQAVIENLTVKSFIFNGTLKQNEAYTSLLRTVLQHDIPIYIAHADMTLHLDRYTALTFMYPYQHPPFQTVSHQNDVSLVSLLHIHQFRMLFTGDIELRSEREIIVNLQGQTGEAVDLMKVAHHGSKTSTSERWLQYWQPKMAVISAGRFNTYGHPHPMVVERLMHDRIPTFRTDVHGEIQLRVSRDDITLRTKLEK